MKKLICLILLLPIILIDFGCKESSTEPKDTDTSTAIVRKPNIYIYPTQNISLSVDINFPKGGNIIESLPEYKNGWKINVEPNGRINKLFDYLFYECKIPEFAQEEYGWIIKRENLEEFFSDNLTSSGFNEKETNDYIDYWIPILVNYDYYEIYPQYKLTLNKVIDINFSEEPDNFFRLCYLIVGRDDNNLQLKEPKIETAVRSGYFAVEWGCLLE